MLSPAKKTVHSRRNCSLVVTPRAVPVLDLRSVSPGGESELGDVTSESCHTPTELPPRSISVSSAISYADEGHACRDEMRAMVSALSPRIATPRPFKPPALLAHIEAAFAPEETSFLGAAEPTRTPTPPVEPIVRSQSAPLHVPPLRRLVLAPDQPSIAPRRDSALGEVTLVAPRDARSNSPLIPRLCKDDDDNNTASQSRIANRVRTSARFRELECHKLPHAHSRPSLSRKSLQGQ